MNYIEHVGKYFLMLGQVFKRPQKLSVFKDALFREIEDLGLKSLGIVAFIAFFVGGVIAIQTALNLRKSYHSKIPHWFCDKTSHDFRIRTNLCFYYSCGESRIFYHFKYWHHACY